jgi:hypothetical protein
VNKSPASRQLHDMQNSKPQPESLEALSSTELEQVIGGHASERAAKQAIAQAAARAAAASAQKKMKNRPYDLI